MISSLPAGQDATPVPTGPRPALAPMTAASARTRSPTPSTGDERTAPPTSLAHVPRTAWTRRGTLLNVVV
ncbi:hypothetical protein AA103196_2521 [Ameyamaea chiangmaiensis NBRC 103196]|uniref:Uncharacterized protein n=1 Tax=Ameyamaea chiangmaiensis TaxID=442969 RepID=A0A850PFT3_9PROT|nr:hypothetical protein [Ameyamaea chiangmaiensis]MBS4075676.1 hypothetical protein [Ameyamaea chiangmaiensis]NVN41499.1 hypothetical protein [Ameyamaea chiangmaiensis]GBQ70558.1 hypothetical protein AA103196_2521 [Ameyamaea chiangmaiensis NBRC 103196]